LGDGCKGMAVTAGLCTSGLCLMSRGATCCASVTHSSPTDQQQHAACFFVCVLFFFFCVHPLCPVLVDVRCLSAASGPAGAAHSGSYVRCQVPRTQSPPRIVACRVLLGSQTCTFKVQTLDCSSSCGRCMRASQCMSVHPKKHFVPLLRSCLPASKGLSRARARAQAPPTDSGAKPPECKQQ